MHNKARYEVHLFLLHTLLVNQLRIASRPDIDLYNSSKSLRSIPTKILVQYGQG